MTQETELLVVGAGPAGLAHAFWRLREDPDLDLRVVERAPEPGGWVRSRRIEGYVCETGPQGFRPGEASDRLVDALGMQSAVIAANPEAKEKFLARDGRLHPLPQGPLELLRTGLLDWRGKLRLMSEPLRRRGGGGEESLAEFVHRRLGPQAVPLAEAMISGIFAGDAHQIEVAAAFPRIAALEREHGGLLRGMRALRSPSETPRPALCSLPGGMQTLMHRLRNDLGTRVTLGRPVTTLVRRGDRWAVTLGGGVQTELLARKVALAIPARQAAKLLRDLDSDLADDLTRIPLASVANIYLGFRDQDARERLRGFGFLLNRSERSEMLGAIYASALFPRSAPEGHFLVRMLAGGMLHRDTIGRDEDELAAAAEELLRSYTGLTAPLTFRRVYKVQDAIPQFVRGHCALVRRIRERVAEFPGLTLMGNSYDDVSVVGQFAPPTE